MNRFGLPSLLLLIFLVISGCTDFFARGDYNKAKALESQHKYREAIEKYKQVITKYPKSQFRDSASVALQQVTSIQFINQYIKDRINQGIPINEALGEFEGIDIIWLARPFEECVRKDLPDQPVQFKIGELAFLGVPYYGIDGLKFIWFCETNEKELLTVEGKLIKASEVPGFLVVVGVNAVARQY